MRNEGCATWDRGNSTWGGRVRVFGTVPVCVSVQEMVYGGGSLLAGKVVKATVRIDDEVVQGQRQRDNNNLQDERQDQPKEEEVNLEDAKG
nr:hypothetical protein [Tanacetum cinerariifolium]